MEIYNSGTNVVSLDGWSLTDQYTNLTRWPFPSGTTINPGQFLLVWLDGQSNQSVAGALHAGFRVPPDTGSLALVFPLNSRPTVLDYLNYAALPADRSLGRFPDGQAGQPQIFYFTTPGATTSTSGS